MERRSISSEKHLNDQNHKIISAAEYAVLLGIMENLKKKNMVTGNMELLLIKEFLKEVTGP
ncbi:MAG: hypothetical protein Q8P23_03250 [bacterium]|nr:hypothetical protein [bacterium]